MVVACAFATVSTSSFAKQFNITIPITCTENSAAGKDRLSKKYGETILVTGIFSKGKHVLHFFANAETGSWSFVSLNMDGIYCLIYSGDGLTYPLKEKQDAETY